ncbi:MAG TPA: hypothetical protein VGK73_10290, partial [Polyangiaceae bacterium]
VANGQPVCSSGMCDISCLAPTTACDGECLDVLTDVEHCGTCSRVCPGAANATPVCNGGSCGLVCNSGHSLCSGVCTNTDTDPDNCGRCARHCPPNKQCIAGSCER